MKKMKVKATKVVPTDKAVLSKKKVNPFSLKKGSAEAKAYMAKLRAKRGKK